jgi:hypothetical protein
MVTGAFQDYVTCAIRPNAASPDHRTHSHRQIRVVFSPGGSRAETGRVPALMAVWVSGHLGGLARVCGCGQVCSRARDG